MCMKPPCWRVRCLLPGDTPHPCRNSTQQSTWGFGQQQGFAATHPQGYKQARLVAVLVLGGWVCFYTRLHHAKCKYHFQWHLPPSCAGRRVYFTRPSHACPYACS